MSTRIVAGSGTIRYAPGLGMKRARTLGPRGHGLLPSLLAATCLLGASRSAAPPRGGPGQEASRAAIEKGVALLASDPFKDPFAYLLSDFLYRRYSVRSLSSSATRFDEFRRTHPEVSWTDVFRRLIDPLQEPKPGWLDGSPGAVRGLDRITVLALYCDQVPPPVDYRDFLERARKEGGYALTHVALALIWSRDNRCQIADRAFEDQVIRDTAALVDADPNVTDLELEAAATVTHLGRAALLPDRFLDAVVAAQQPGGGWSEESGKALPADWHPTFLALWLLLETGQPGGSAPMVPRPASP
jgi:hypothetical protein